MKNAPNMAASPDAWWETTKNGPVKPTNKSGRKGLGKPGKLRGRPATFGGGRRK